MGLPVIPEKTQPEAFTDLLESIALEEVGLAHLINAEAEKVQSAADLMITEGERRMTPEEVIEFQKEIIKVIQTAIKMQMLLQFKLETTLEAKLKLEAAD